MSLSDQLKYARKASGITQQEMADGLNVSKSTYSRYESGERKFPSNKLADAAMLLGVSVSSLLGTSDDLLEIKKDPPAEADEPVDVSEVMIVYGISLVYAVMAMICDLLVYYALTWMCLISFFIRKKKKPIPKRKRLQKIYYI